MTDPLEYVEEQERRYETYIQLFEFKPFRTFLEELTELEQGIKDSIAECITPGDDNMFDKGRRHGILEAIDFARLIVEEYEKNKQSQNEENS